MPRFTILNIIHATIIVALSCRLATLVAWDPLSTYIVASSCTGMGVGLWCFVAGRISRRPAPQTHGRITAP